MGVLFLVPKDGHRPLRNVFFVFWGEAPVSALLSWSSSFSWPGRLAYELEVTLRLGFGARDRRPGIGGVVLGGGVLGGHSSDRKLRKMS